jgi:hypothetical protein
VAAGLLALVRQASNSRARDPVPLRVVKGLSAAAGTTAALVTLA